MDHFPDELPHEPITCDAFPGLQFFIAGDRERLSLFAQDTKDERFTIVAQVSRWGKLLRGVDVPGNFPHIPGIDANGALPIAFMGEGDGPLAHRERRGETTSIAMRTGESFYLAEEDGSLVIRYRDPRGRSHIYGLINRDGTFYRWMAATREMNPNWTYNDDGGIVISNPFHPAKESKEDKKSKLKPVRVGRGVRQEDVRGAQEAVEALINHVHGAQQGNADGGADQPARPVDEAQEQVERYANVRMNADGNVEIVNEAPAEAAVPVVGADQQRPAYALPVEDGDFDDLMPDEEDPRDVP